MSTAASPTVRLVLAPGPRDSIEEVDVTRAGVLVARYSNVRGQLERFTFDGRAWTGSRLPLNDTGAVGIVSADVDEDVAYATYTDFLQPTTLYSTNVATQKGDADQGDAGEVRCEPVYDGSVRGHF